MRRLVPTIALLALAATACSGDVATAPTDEASTPTPTTAPPTPSAPDDSTPPTTATPTPEAPAEVRAVWAHLFDDTLKSRASVDAMLDEVAAAGFNTVVAEVVRRQDAYYDSDVLPRTTDPALEDGFDLIGYGVEAAHARGLEFHAWIPTMPAYHGTYDDLPAPDGWVWTQHGPDAPEDQQWITRHADGGLDDHLDPGLPAVREHVAAIAGEIASTYDVDGVHLDYVRYPTRGTGYNPAALARYREDTGATGTPDPSDPGFAAWKREQVRALLAETVDAVDAADPDIPVSAAVIAQAEGPHDGFGFDRTRGYTDFHQDWPAWLRDGLLDAAFPMVYVDASEHGEWFDQWATFAARLADEVDPIVAGGVAGYLNPPDHTVPQIQRMRGGTDGVVLYSYQQTTESEPYDRLFGVLSDDVWEGRAPTPDWTP